MEYHMEAALRSFLCDAGSSNRQQFYQQPQPFVSSTGTNYPRIGFNGSGPHQNNWLPLPPPPPPPPAQSPLTPAVPGPSSSFNGFGQTGDDGIIVKVNQQQQSHNNYNYDNYAPPTATTTTTAGDGYNDLDLDSSWLDDFSCSLLSSPSFNEFTLDNNGLDDWDGINFEENQSGSSWNALMEPVPAAAATGVNGYGKADEVTVVKVESSASDVLPAAGGMETKQPWAEEQSGCSMVVPIGNMSVMPRPSAPSSSSSGCYYEAPTSCTAESPPRRIKFWEQKCEICKLVVVGGQQCYEAHMSNAHDCSCICGMTFKNKIKATHHIKKMARTEGVEVDGILKHGLCVGNKMRPVYECDFCDQFFRHRHMAVKHRNTVHLALPEIPHQKRARKRSQEGERPSETSEKPSARRQASKGRRRRGPTRTTEAGGNLRLKPPMNKPPQALQQSVAKPLPQSQLQRGNVRGMSSAVNNYHGSEPPIPLQQAEPSSAVTSQIPVIQGPRIVQSDVPMSTVSTPKNIALPLNWNGQSQQDLIAGSGAILPTASTSSPLALDYPRSAPMTPTGRKPGRSARIAIGAPQKRPKMNITSSSPLPAQLQAVFTDPKPNGWTYCSHNNSRK